MEKKIEEGAAKFCEMLADFVQKKLGNQIKHFIVCEGEEAGISFREDLYMLFSLYLGKEKRILLFSNLKKMHPAFRDELINLFSFLGFVIDDKSKRS